MSLGLFTSDYFRDCGSVAFSALTRLVGRKGIRPVKKWRDGSGGHPDGVAPSQMVSVFACVNLPLHHKVQKFSSDTG